MMETLTIQAGSPTEWEWKSVGHSDSVLKSAHRHSRLGVLLEVVCYPYFRDQQEWF